MYLFLLQICYIVNKLNVLCNLHASVNKQIVEVIALRDCLQDEVQFPLFWCLIVDSLLRGLNVAGCITLGLYS